MTIEINDIEYNHPDAHTSAGGSSDSGNAFTGGDAGRSNKGMLMLDDTCAPQHIAFPQDINLLNEARENLESIIDAICYEYDKPKPRTY